MYNRADNTARHALVSLVIRRYVTDVEWISKSTAISARVGREEDATGRIACSACAYERWKWYEIDVVSEMEHLRLSLDVIFAPLLAAAVLATKRISGPSPFSWHLLHSPDLSVIDVTFFLSLFFFVPSNPLSPLLERFIVGSGAPGNGEGRSDQITSRPRIWCYRPAPRLVRLWRRWGFSLASTTMKSWSEFVVFFPLYCVCLFSSLQR